MAAAATAYEPAAADRRTLPLGVRRWSRRVVAVAAPGLVVGWMWSHQGLLVDGARLMQAAEKEWLVVAVLAAAARWPAGGLNLQGAVRQRLPVRGLLAAQMAGSFANLVVPLGLGANGVDARFLYRCGLPLPRAVAAVAVSVAAGLTVNALLLVAMFTAAGPTLAARFHAPPSLVAGAALSLVAVPVIASSGTVRRHCGRLAGSRVAGLRAVGADLGHLMRRPSRALMLWGGAILQKSLPALIFVALLRSLHVAAPTVQVLGAYFVASCLSGLVPAPAGLGSVELTLGMALAAVGVSAATAVAGVLGYRVLTCLLPVIPAGAAFVYLMRRDAL